MDNGMREQFLGSRDSGQMALTHCGLVTPYDDMDIGQHWFK